MNIKVFWSPTYSNEHKISIIFANVDNFGLIFNVTLQIKGKAHFKLKLTDLSN